MVKDRAAIKFITRVLGKSELIKTITELKKEVRKTRSLTEEEIKVLVNNGNSSINWSKVKVKRGFNPERIKNSILDGDIVLGVFDSQIELEKGINVNSGIYNSSLFNVTIGDNVLLKDVKTLANYIINDKVIISNCGAVVCSGKTSFGNGREIPIAIETGGREVFTFAEIDIDTATEIASSREDKELIKKYNSLVEDYVKKVTSEFGIIDEAAVIKNSSKIVNAFIGKHAHIDNVTLIDNTTVLSNEEEKTEISEGAFVKKSIIQWGSEVTSMAIVVNSVMVEHSHAERHAKITDSIIGPNTGIGEGEVTASLVGPFVGFHHQALLIAAFWPDGKGNIGYGANVGSNHTSKAPDQEIWPGEGTFFGLGVNIKFPSDLTRAPYSILATGVTTLPQKIEFPFSLINGAAVSFEDISPAYNEIIPAWVLSDNIFTIRRNEGKYMKRNKAKRANIVFEVFRPEIVDIMKESRSKLKDIIHIKRFYTDKEIKGLGKNYLLEANRKKAIETYSFYIQYYALSGLKKKLEEYVDNRNRKKIKNILYARTSDTRWEHERKILLEEFENKTVKELLHKLIEVQEVIAKETQVSKEKDDSRGARIIKDYTVVHAPASEDSFVKQTYAETKKIKDEINALLKIVKD